LWFVCWRVLVLGQPKVSTPTSRWVVKIETAPQNGIFYQINCDGGG
jgi:hypothetical protein